MQVRLLDCAGLAGLRRVAVDLIGTPVACATLVTRQASSEDQHPKRWQLRHRVTRQWERSARHELMADKGGVRAPLVKKTTGLQG